MSARILGFSPARMGALLLRHYYLLTGSWTRLVDLIYWPAVQMVMWGFLTQFLASQNTYYTKAFGLLLAGLLLWDTLFRVQLSVAISFLEEMWSRNLANLFVTPLRPGEFAASLLVMGLLRTLLGMLPVALMAWAFFDFSIFSMGLALAVYLASLTLFGWALGLAVCGLVMRQGMGAENIAWAAAFLFLPISAVYYPVAVLPSWLQAIAWSFPPAYVFEGMRALLIDNVVRTDLMLRGLLLNAGYLALGVLAFLALFESARRRGQLLGQGE